MHLDYIAYDDKSLWNIEQQNIQHNESRDESFASPMRRLHYVKTSIDIKIYAPERFKRIQELDGISNDVIRNALLETKNRS